MVACFEEPLFPLFQDILQQDVQGCCWWCCSCCVVDVVVELFWLVVMLFLLILTAMLFLSPVNFIVIDVNDGTLSLLDIIETQITLKKDKICETSHDTRHRD